MTWYAASVLIAIRPILRTNEKILVYENVMLIESPSSDEASQKAVSLAAEEVSLNDKLTIDGDPAERSFLGIRKLIAVRNPPPLDADKDRPVSGTEITYSMFEVASEADLTKLTSGMPANLIYVE